ncbi:hypothetical protein ACSTJB_23380, partial [Vibrio parahaemolyticus]
EVHKAEWTGFFIAPETGTYRLGITGMKGAVEAPGGKVLVSAERYSQWAEPIKLVDVDLRKGERYPLHFEGE